MQSETSSVLPVSFVDSSESKGRGSFTKKSPSSPHNWIWNSGISKELVMECGNKRSDLDGYNCDSGEKAPPTISSPLILGPDVGPNLALIIRIIHWYVCGSIAFRRCPSKENTV